MAAKEEQMLYDEGTLDVVSLDGAVGYIRVVCISMRQVIWGLGSALARGWCRDLGPLHGRRGLLLLAGDKVTMEYCWMAEV